MYRTVRYDASVKTCCKAINSPIDGMVEFGTLAKALRSFLPQRCLKRPTHAGAIKINDFNMLMGFQCPNFNALVFSSNALNQPHAPPVGFVAQFEVITIKVLRIIRRQIGNRFAHPRGRNMIFPGQSADRIDT